MEFPLRANGGRAAGGGGEGQAERRAIQQHTVGVKYHKTILTYPYKAGTKEQVGVSPTNQALPRKLEAPKGVRRVKSAGDIKCGFTSHGPLAVGGDGLSIKALAREITHRTQTPFVAWGRHHTITAVRERARCNATIDTGQGGYPGHAGSNYE